jgi:hypothetical protein
MTKHLRIFLIYEDFFSSYSMYMSLHYVTDEMFLGFLEEQILTSLTDKGCI